MHETKTPTTLNFGPGATTETLSGRAYFVNEYATEYANGSVPATVTLNLIDHNVAANFSVVGGLGVADAYYNGAHPAGLTVNFAHRLTTTGIEAHVGNLTFSGHQLNNNGIVDLITSHAQINADVVGSGTWDMQLSNLTLDGKVGPGQTFDIENAGGPSNLTIDDPRGFHGLVNVETGYLGSVTLADLTATAYSYLNNSLILYRGNKVVDHLRFADANTFGVYQSASGVVISNFSQGTALPFHHACT